MSLPLPDSRASPGWGDFKSGARMRADGGAARLGAQYDGDPARGTSCLLWEAAVPKWGRVVKSRCLGGDLRGF